MSDSNVELQLKKLNGESVDLPEPRSRVELYLAKLNGESVELPEPQSRVEELLYELSQRSGDDGSSAFVDAIVKAYTEELVDITLPSKFDAITTASASDEGDIIFMLPTYVQSISSNSVTVIPNGLGAISFVKNINLPNVKILGNESFYKCDELTSVYLPSLEQAYSKAFADCTNLETLTLPSLQKMGNEVFVNLTSSKLTTLKTGTLTETQPESFKILNRGPASKSVLSNVEIGEGTSADLYLHYSEAYTQEVLHNIIANLADLSDAETPGEFCVGDVNLEKIDTEYINMLENKNWNYS